MATKTHGKHADPSAGEEKSTAKATAEIAPMAAATPPGPPFVAGTAITVTPYRAPGRPPIYMVAGMSLGSEEDVLMTLKNQMFLPPVKLT